MYLGYTQQSLLPNFKQVDKKDSSETQSTSAELQPLSPDDLRQKRLMYLNKTSNPDLKTNVQPGTASDADQIHDERDVSEDDLLKQAIAMSMEHS
ncbi:hypothetical protein Btru_003073 [Bulinus truncatus]|nr:hypothetical protein Btru_003073 [Bulinus truncatus]